MVNLILTQTRELLDVLSVESVSVIGILLVIIGYLVRQASAQKKEFNEEKKELKEEVKEAREKLEVEYNLGNNEMKSVIEKYYVLSTKVLDHLKTRL